MSQPKNSESQPKTILIVDDDRDSVELLSVLFKRSGYDTVPALSGKEALEIFRKNKPDLMTVDLGMPEMDGYELIIHIRKTDPLLPIIILSAYARREDRETFSIRSKRVYSQTGSSTYRSLQPRIRSCASGAE